MSPVEGKVMALKEATKLIRDGDIIGCGGFSVSRCPSAFAHEMIRQKKRDLTLVGSNLSFQMDLLVGGGCVKRCESGTGNLEKFGIAFNFRRACEKGRLEMEDHSHLAMASRFLAGEMGLPFMPLMSWLGSDILQHKQPSTEKKFTMIDDPFNPGKRVCLVPALNPDVSIIHAQKADEMGNVMLGGCLFHEVEMVRASKKVLVTCEKIVNSKETRKNPQMTTIPYIYVTAIVEQPWGAHPTSVFGYYDYDGEHLNHYQECARAGGEKYERYLNEYVHASETFDEYLEKVGGTQRLSKLRTSRRQIKR